MDRLVYIAAAGTREIMHAQAVNAHNLANASTPGFRADLLMAQSLMVDGEGHDSRVYANTSGQGVNLRQGVVNVTGRELDVAVNGEGWMVVATPDGGEAYSRRGDLRVNEYGQLTDGAGRALVGNSGPIALPPFSDIAIGADGSISIVPLGEAPNTLAVVDRIKLVNPDQAQLTKTEDGFIRLRNDQLPQPEADANVTLVSGSLESSNIDSISAMVQMIELSRQFEAQARMMKTAEELDRSSAEMMRMS